MMATIEQAAEVFKGSKHPLIITGAGISAESGIPTFRGKDGLWKNYRAEELATPQAFARDSKLVWQWYNWRKDLIKEKQPNAAHFALTELQNVFEIAVVTQNVDGFHRLAGNKNVIEMHGNIFEARCTECLQLSELIDTSSDNPLCKECSALLRPHIVWFGESLDPGNMQKISMLLQRCDLLLVIGTSGIVYPAAGFASQVMNTGGKVIEINIDLSREDSENYLGLEGRAGTVVPALVSAVK